jgi:PEP-CTERM motif-containing protein
MKRNTRSWAFLASLVTVACCATARADLSFSTSPTISSYLGSPVYTSAPATAATVAQGNPALVGGAANFVLSETFTPSSSYLLNEIHILAGVSAPGTTLGLHLYDVTGVDKQAAGAFYFPGTDLFGNGAGLSFTVATGGQSQWIFSLSNGSTLDLVNLTAGNTYALELWTPSAVGQNNVQWYRAGVVATDGQMMGAGDSASSQSRNTIAALGLAGGAPRTASLALYAVPEPSSLALLGFGSLVGTFLIRRKK